jgi:hypothetical protein
MASIEDYNAKLDVITAIPESETKSPNMPVRAGAFRQAETNWFNDRFNQEEAAKAWDVSSDVGHKFYDELLHSFFHAYRRDEALIRRVRSIVDGNGHADMIQDRT